MTLTEKIRRCLDAAGIDAQQRAQAIANGCKDFDQLKSFADQFAASEGGRSYTRETIEAALIDLLEYERRK